MPSFLKKRSSKKLEKSFSQVSLTPNDLETKFAHGEKVGVANWELHFSEDNTRAYFFDPAKNTTAWGLPLRDVLKNPGVVGPEGDDDWECHVDASSRRRFYSSDKRKRVQWTIPLIYRLCTKNIPFFTDDWGGTMPNNKVSIVEENNDEPFAYSRTLGSRASIPNLADEKKRETLEMLLKRITMEQVLDNNTTCAGFHRFLLALHAEENLIFWGACEVFAKGEWKGMKVLGIKDFSDPAIIEDEAAVQLQEQMAGTRVSKRIGRIDPTPISAADEAKLIHRKFLVEGAEMWVCVNQKIERDIAKGIEEQSEILQNRTIFSRAQTEVVRNMQDDLLPRFVNAAMSEKPIKIGGGSVFESDEVLRFALKQLSLEKKSFRQ